MVAGAEERPLGGVQRRSIGKVRRETPRCSSHALPLNALSVRPKVFRPNTFWNGSERRRKLTRPLTRSSVAVLKPALLKPRITAAALVSAPSAPSRTVHMPAREEHYPHILMVLGFDRTWIDAGTNLTRPSCFGRRQGDRFGAWCCEKRPELAIPHTVADDLSPIIDVRCPLQVPTGT